MNLGVGLGHGHAEGGEQTTQSTRKRTVHCRATSTPLPLHSLTLTTASGHLCSRRPTASASCESSTRYMSLLNLLRSSTLGSRA